METDIWEVRVWHEVNTMGGVFKEGMTYTDYSFYSEEAAKGFCEQMRAKGLRAGWRHFTV
jgi:hypothetical protein